MNLCDFVPHMDTIWTPNTISFDLFDMTLVIHWGWVKIDKSTKQGGFAMPKTIRHQEKVNLLEIARKSAKENGREIDPETAKGLRAIQAMHDLAKKVKGSPYRVYCSEQRRQ